VIDAPIMGPSMSLMQIDRKGKSSIPGVIVHVVPTTAISRAMLHVAHLSPEATSATLLFPKVKVEDEELQPKRKKRTDGREEGTFDEAESLEVKKQKTNPADPEGYRFRKYGQKMIEKEARHYFRCTFPDCEVKRHVT
jgi:hypothetical protein